MNFDKVNEKLGFLKEIAGDKFDIYLAGGAVRDLILGHEVKDYDIVVDGDINAGLKFAEFAAKQLGVYKKDSNPVVYPKYGTAKLFYEGVDYEFVAPRRESYEEGSRKPSVSSCSLSDDAFRRDLTINSLFLNIKTNEILDFTKFGLTDIANRFIDTPLDPDITFTDDPLRMLRVVRFAFRYGWDIHDYVVSSIKKNANKLQTISKERINEEFTKILLGNNHDVALVFLSSSGLLQYIVPELQKSIGITQNKHHIDDVFSHTISVVSKVKPDLVTRLGALFHDIGKRLSRSEEDGEIHFYRHEVIGAALTGLILRDLKYPNEIKDKVIKIVANHMQLKFATDEAKISNKALRKFVVRNSDILEPLLDVMDADNKSHSEESSMPNQIRLIKEKIKNLEIKPEKPQLPISGKDLIDLGLTPSPLFGTLLGKVEEAWYENPELNKEEALKIVEENLNGKTEKIRKTRTNKYWKAGRFDDRRIW